MIEIREGDAVLLCGPVANVPGTDIITADCGHPAAISPSSRELQDKLDCRTVTICLICGMQHPEVRKSLEAQGVFLTTAQREELNREIGVARADQTLAQLRVTEVDL